MSVCVCFLYIVNYSFVFLRYIVRSRKLKEFCIPFSMANFMLACCLLNSVKVSPMFVFL
jgi:hypothetical protein